MSGGKSSSQSQQSSQSQSTAQQELDPQIKAALLGNFNSFGQNVPGYTPYTGDKVAGFTPQQQQSFGLVGDIANNQTGSAPLNAGITAAQGVAGFTPQQVSASTAQAGLINPNSVSMVAPQSVANTDLSPYMSPYSNDVIGADTTAALNALNQENEQTQGDATKAGAWRGTANAVQQGVNQSQTNIGLAQQIANLLNTNYETALGTATSDANRNLTAQQGNQSTQLAEGATNAGNTTTTNLANASNLLQAGLANQSAGLTGANLRLTAGQSLASMGGQQLSDAATRASLLNQSGSQQQQQSQALLDWQYQNGYLNPQQYAMALQQLKNQTLGLAGNPVLGNSQSTSSAQGTSSAQSTNFNSGLSFNPLTL